MCKIITCCSLLSTISNYKSVISLEDYQLLTFFVVVVVPADFGFARFLPGEMMAATLCGSPMYMVCE